MGSVQFYQQLHDQHRQQFYQLPMRKSPSRLSAISTQTVNPSQPIEVNLRIFVNPEQHSTVNKPYYMHPGAISPQSFYPPPHLLGQYSRINKTIKVSQEDVKSSENQVGDYEKQKNGQNDRLERFQIEDSVGMIHCPACNQNYHMKEQKDHLAKHKAMARPNNTQANQILSNYFRKKQQEQAKLLKKEPIAPPVQSKYFQVEDSQSVQNPAQRSSSTVQLKSERWLIPGGVAVSAQGSQYDEDDLSSKEKQDQGQQKIIERDQGEKKLFINTDSVVILPQQEIQIETPTLKQRYSSKQSINSSSGFARLPLETVHLVRDEETYIPRQNSPQKKISRYNSFHKEEVEPSFKSVHDSDKIPDELQSDILRNDSDLQEKRESSESELSFQEKSRSKKNAQSKENKINEKSNPQKIISCVSQSERSDSELSEDPLADSQKMSVKSGREEKPYQVNSILMNSSSTFKKKKVARNILAH